MVLLVLVQLVVTVSLSVKQTSELRVCFGLIIDPLIFQNTNNLEQNYLKTMSVSIGKYDEVLTSILVDEKSILGFLSTIFNFLARRCVIFYLYGYFRETTNFYLIINVLRFYSCTYLSSLKLKIIIRMFQN